MCLIARKYKISGSKFETSVVKRHLGIDIPRLRKERAGDGGFNCDEETYNAEIKVSYSGEFLVGGFSQIRPDHDVQFYIFILFDLHEGLFGKAKMFVIPATNLYKRLVAINSSGHGVKEKLLKGEKRLSMENIYGNNLELSY